MTMKSITNNLTLERALRLFVCIAILGVFFTMPVFADNEYAQKGALWILDAIYWIALVVIIWKLIMSIIARNLIGSIVLFLAGALCIVLIGKPELFKTVGEKLLSIVGLS